MHEDPDCDMTIEEEPRYVSLGMGLGPDGKPRIGDLAVVLDALVRYLADKQGDTLRTIAALMKALPIGAFPNVHLGCDAQPTHDMLEQLGGRCRVLAVDEDTERPCVWHEIDGVEFTAQYVRPRTL